MLIEVAESMTDVLLLPHCHCPKSYTFVKTRVHHQGQSISVYERGQEKVFKTLLVITVGLLPSLISLWVIRKTRWRERRRLQQAAINVSGTGLRLNIRPVEGDRDRGASPREALLRSADRYYLEGVGYLVGDISCKFNARSGYVRCAVNPSGPCQDCRHYEPRELASTK